MKKLPHLFVLGLLSLCLTLILIDSGGYEKIVKKVFEVQDSVESNLTALALATPRETGNFQALPVFDKNHAIFNNN